jgi:hypothetical protein
MKRTQSIRRGVTLVELLVAAAMCIMGMWLLTWLYQQGLESFRQARAQADLTSQQRMFTQMITRDLEADHFESEDNDKPNGGKRVRDQWLHQIKPDPADPTKFTGYKPPKRGYFRAGSFPIDNVNNISEGSDLVADSSRSTNHFLQFTVILQGGSNFQQFSAEVPANQRAQYFGTAAEVTYFLYPTGEKLNGNYPLYDLYRKQRLVARNTEDATAFNPAIQNALSLTPPDNVAEVMVLKGNQIATLEDLTVPQGPYAATYRLTAFTPNAAGSARFGEDKLLSNVLSFEIKFTGNGILPDGTPWPRPFATPNTDYPYDTLPFDGNFDTFSQQADQPGMPVIPWNSMTNLATQTNTTLPLKQIRITGVQIRLRTFDTKTRSTRQTTVIVDL